MTYSRAFAARADCLVRFCLAMIFVNMTTVRAYVYKDALKMPLGAISWMWTAAKAIDLLVGFLIGKASDAAKTGFGRRKPFIAVCFPLGVGAVLLFASAGQLFGFESEATPPCNHMPPLETASATCAALKSCLDAAISNGTLPAPDSLSMQV